jgi:isochorismate synthase
MTAPDAATLGAVTLEVDDPIDTLGAADAGGFVFHRGGHRLGAWGIAATLPLVPAGVDDARGAGQWLAALADTSGIDPHDLVAWGALPFDRHAPASLVVPRLVVADDGRRRRAILVAPRGEATVTALRASLDSLPTPPAVDHRAHAGPGARIDDPAAEAERYTKSVATALEAIGRGEIEKVVLARSVDVLGASPWSAAAAVHRLRDQEPDCTAFAAPDGGGVFLGASPELLIERVGAEVHSTPLAGTAACTGDDRADDRRAAALLASVKDRREHGPVVEAIRRSLAPRCATLSVPAEPVAARLNSVIHLATDIRGTLRDPAPGVLELLADLHPTPAVGGTPRAEALAMISRLEPHGRGSWAGAVGHVDAAGDGQWVIAIRSAVLGAHGARLWAGAGIVEGSDPTAELAETTVKLRPVLQALYPESDTLLDALR